MATPGKTVDVIIGSTRSSFTDAIQAILKGYYPYQLQQFKSVDALLEHSTENFNPALALIDGQDGTGPANEWVQSTKMSHPECHVIVLHSAAAVIDFSVVKKNGADEVMHLNFDREFISDMVLTLAPIEMEGDQIPITALTPVDLRDIEAGVTINFDVYAHLPANHRSVVLRRSGDTIDVRHVEKFNSLNQQMYVKKTHLPQFFEYARTNMSMRDMPFPISMTEKFHRSKKAIYEIMTQFLNGAATDYQEGKVIYEKCKSIIGNFELTKDLSDKEISDEICRFAGNLRTYYHDCICLSAYAAYFAQLLGWDQSKREAVAIAGLLHNIGLSQLPTTAGDKLLKDLTPDELAEYKRYPERSVNMVKSKKVPLTVEISEAMGQHRENGRGTGFPKGILAADISPMGKLMIAAHRFHELTSLQEGRAAATPGQAMNLLKEIAISGSGEVDLVTVTTVAKKFKT